MGASHSPSCLVILPHRDRREGTASRQEKSTPLAPCIVLIVAEKKVPPINRKSQHYQRHALCSNLCAFSLSASQVSRIAAKNQEQQFMDDLQGRRHLKSVGLDQHLLLHLRVLVSVRISTSMLMRRMDRLQQLETASSSGHWLKNRVLYLVWDIGSKSRASWSGTLAQWLWATPNWALKWVESLQSMASALCCSHWMWYWGCSALERLCKHTWSPRFLTPTARDDIRVSDMCDIRDSGLRLHG